MDIADKFQKVRIFFTDYRFIPILKEMATTFVSFVEGYSMPGHEAAHDFAEWCRADAQ